MNKNNKRRLIAGLLLAGMIVTAPVQARAAFAADESNAADAAVQIEQEAEEVKEAKEPHKAKEVQVQPEAEEVTDIADDEVPKSEKAADSEVTAAEDEIITGEAESAEAVQDNQEVIEIEDREIPLVLYAEVYTDEEEKAEATDIGITVKGILPEGSEAKAWPVKAEGKDFAAYQIVITDRKGNEIHSAAEDNKTITVIIDDPELTKGLEKRNNVSGQHRNNKGNMDSKLEYEILNDGSVSFETDIY